MFKIAAIGIIVAVLNQLLIRSGREDQAMMTTLAGLVVVLSMLVQQISDLFGPFCPLMALEHLLPTLGLAAAAALLYGLLHKSNPAFALLLSLAAGLAILVRLTVPLQQMAAGLAALAARVDGAAFASLLRCAGVLLLTDYACAVCKEAEAEALAWCTSFAGRVLTLAALWPLLEEVCGMVWELTG